jgi:hypothetical protein
MIDKIIERILREANNPDLLDALAYGLNASDLQSLLLEVYRRRAKRLTPRDVLRQFEQNRFVQLAAANPQEMVEFDRLAYSLLPPDVEVVELSPVAPLGSNSVVATVDQNNAVTTIRNTEVCSDCTNVMALECARRRREMTRRKPSLARVKLCASHRLLRPQMFEGPASFAHFRVLALCTAGREERNLNFETETLVEHITFYLKLIEASKQSGFNVGQIKVVLTAFDENWYQTLNTEVLEKLATRHPSVEFAFDQNRESGRGYYRNAGFQINISDLSGEFYLIVDGGFTDWTQQFLSDRRERLLISGFGSERFVYVFG